MVFSGDNDRTGTNLYISEGFNLTCASPDFNLETSAYAMALSYIRDNLAGKRAEQ